MGRKQTTQRRVQWSDTDAAGIAHFTAFFRYMEEAEHEFLRTAGLSVAEAEGEDLVSWPRVHAQCDYRGAVRFEDVLDVELEVTRVGDKSVTYQYAFTYEGQPVADGHVTAVCCRMTVTGPQAIAIPERFLKAFEA